MNGLIAFTGFKRCGKDAAAQALVDHGWTRIPLAGGLKAMLTALFEYQGYKDHGAIKEMLEGNLKEWSNPLLAGATSRHAMQQLGTEWGRIAMPEDMWTLIALNRAKQFSWVVISDVRFHNEVRLIQHHGGKVFRINRPGCNVGVDPHPSEQQIPFLQVDGELNNDGTLKDLKSKVEGLFHSP